MPEDCHLKVISENKFNIIMMILEVWIDSLLVKRTHSYGCQRESERRN